MKALSITQPWPWIILHLGKRIENRSRNIGSVRGPLFLHATSSMRREDWERAVAFVRQRSGDALADTIPVPTWKDSVKRGVHPELPLGVIVARTEIIARRPGPQASWTVSAQKAQLPPTLLDQEKRWYMGQYAYLLGAVTPVHPIPARGFQCFWEIPAEIAEQLEAA